MSLSERDRGVCRRSARAGSNRARSWRVGNAVVSIEEIVSWQLGPLLHRRDSRTADALPRQP
jgi:hypothetical protein